MFRLKIYSKPWRYIYWRKPYLFLYFNAWSTKEIVLNYHISRMEEISELLAIVYCFEKRVINDLHKEPWSSLKMMSRGLLPAWSPQCFAFLTQLPWVLFARSIPFLLFIIGVFQVYHLMGHNQWTFNFASLTLLAITWICIRTGPSIIAVGASELTTHTLRHYL